MDKPMTRPAASMLVVIFMLGTTNAPANAADEEDARLSAFFRSYLDELFRRHPMEATRLGDQRFNDRLDDLSPKARAESLEFQRATLKRLSEQVAYDKLSRSGQIDFEILRHELTRRIWEAENTRRFEQDARVWNEYVSDSVFLLFTQSTAPKADNLRNAAARITGIPRVLAAARASLKDPPKVFVETAIRQNRGAIAFYEKGVFDITGETPQLSELAKPSRAAVAELRRYQDFLQDTLLPTASGDWRLGRERFARKLDLELDAGVTADEVVRDAEAEADRVRSAMYVLARQLWAKHCPGKPPLPPDDAAGRRETIQRVMDELAKDHGTSDTLVKDAQATVDMIRQFIRERNILKLPDPDRCKVIEMPEFQRGNSVAYLNPAPPLDPKADSVYAVAPPPKEWTNNQVESFFREYNRNMLKVLTIHEAFPGHYVQLEYSNRHPSLVRRVLSSGVFAEGWAVYTEQMMLDQGFGDGDPALRLQQLKFYLRAVINAIVDHRMHCSGMTDDEAMKLLMEGAFQTEGEALGKVVRAKQSSCQLSTYFVGRMAFYRLRQQLSRELGERCDLARFHESVLSHGTLPVKYLPELVRKDLMAAK